MAIYDLTEKDFDVSGARFAIAAARFNAKYVDKLLEGALGAFARHGVESDRILTVRVPGAFEIPLAAQRLAQRGDIDGVLTLGCVLRGGTAHFEYVCAEVSRGVTLASLNTNKPIAFGVLTLDTDEQAAERTGGAHGNKGDEAALALLEMVTVLRLLDA